MNLVIDIGNTKIKTAIFSEDTLKKEQSFEKIEELILFLEKFDGQIAVSNVSFPQYTEAILSMKPSALFVNAHTPMPIGIDYETPNTLGVDRIIASVAAFYLCKTACLAVDIGTCMTLDFVDSDGVFKGGNISPGPDIRFRSMHNFTASLPLESLNIESKSIGKSTKEALQSGVKFGIVHEIMGTYRFLLDKNPNIKLVLTGGYTSFFDSILKEGIFVVPNLVLIGLNTILNHNVKK